MDNLDLIGYSGSGAPDGGERVYTFRFTGSQPHAAFSGAEVRLIVKPSAAGWLGSITLQLSADGFTPVGEFSSEEEAERVMKRVAGESRSKQKSRGVVPRLFAAWQVLAYRT